MIWLFLSATLSRASVWRSRHRLTQMMLILNLGHLKRRVVERVLQAQAAWKRLVISARRQRAARVLQRAFRRFAAIARRRRIRATVPVLITFFGNVGRRARMARAIASFRSKVLRLQRWWRRTLPVIRARREFLERLWTRTLMLRWEELVKYRLYLFNFLLDAAAGSYTSALPPAAASLTVSLVRVPPEERQRFANLVTVWKHNEEEAHAHCMLSQPPPFAQGTAPYETTAATASHTNTYARPALQAPSTLQMAGTNPAHPGIDLLWERFVCALFLRVRSSHTRSRHRRPPSSSDSARDVSSLRHTSRQSKSRTKSTKPPIEGVPLTFRDEVSMSVAASDAGPGDKLRPSSAETTRAAAAPSTATATATSLGMVRKVLSGGPRPQSANRPPSQQSQQTQPSTPTATTSTMAPALPSASSLSPFHPFTCSSSFAPSPCDRAQLEFESYLGLTKLSLPRESVASAFSSPASPNLSSPQLHAAGSHGPLSPAANSNGGSVMFTFTNVEGASPLVMPAGGVNNGANGAASSSLAPGVMLRRAILRALYLRVRRMHRNMIYQVRAFAAPIAGRGGLAAHAATAAAVAGPSDSDSAAAAAAAHWRVDTGLDPPRVRHWFHLLHASGVQELMMESMVPRSLHSLWSSGVLLGRSRSELVRMLRDNTNDRSVQLSHHAGWPIMPQIYGQQTEAWAHAQAVAQASAAAAAAVAAAAATLASVGEGSTSSSSSSSSSSASSPRPSSGHLPSSSSSSSSSRVRPTTPNAASGAGKSSGEQQQQQQSQPQQQMHSATDTHTKPARKAMGSKHKQAVT